MKTTHEGFCISCRLLCGWALNFLYLMLKLLFTTFLSISIDNKFSSSQRNTKMNTFFLNPDQVRENSWTLHAQYVIFIDRGLFVKTKKMLE